jgi:hypothetical protein
MKSKMTLSIEQQISHQAKTLAKQRGTSLSKMIENFLREELEPVKTKNSANSFSQRWAGTMELTESTDERAQKLKRKYKLQNP